MDIKNLVKIGLDVNEAKVYHTRGADSGVVNANNKEEIDRLENLYSWHFVWSKFYF